MRHYFIFLFLLMLSCAHAQPKVLESIYSVAKKETVVKYANRTDYEYIVIGSEFSKETVQKIPIRDRRIIQIDLVYSSYRESSQFSQKDLNLARIQKLLDYNPDLLVNQFFEWRLVEQTGCSSSLQCRDFFHGFVVYYDKYYTREDMKVEIDTINRLMVRLENQLTEMDSLKRYQVFDKACDIPPMNFSNRFLGDEFKKYFQCNEKFTGMVFFSVQMDDKGRPVTVNIKGSLFPCKEILSNVLKHVLRWKRGLVIDGKSYPLMAEGKVTFPLDKECVTITGYKVSDPLTKKFNVEVRGVDCSAYLVDSFYTDIIPRIDKEVVSTVLFRNSWDESLMVVDATGSMYPYTTDLLKWLRLTSQTERTYVFFNDGDDKPTNQKIVGKTGGINHVTTDSYVDVRNGLFRTMSKGGGGDLLENNIEALLYGVNASGVNDAIMIVDNHSFPRDVSLLKDYTGQLKLILCGTTGGINTYYLDLARKYGFSIHTLVEDLPALNNMKIGQSIRIGAFAYKLEPEGFKRIF